MTYSNAVIKAISKNIYKTTHYPVYINHQPQNIVFPSFCITCDGEQEQKLNERYYRSDTYYIKFFQSECEVAIDYDKMRDVAEQLYFTLEYITVDGSLIRGTNMSERIIDDVLEFKVDYCYFLLKQEKKDVMKHLEIDERVKGNGRRSDDN